MGADFERYAMSMRVESEVSCEVKQQKAKSTTQDLCLNRTSRQPLPDWFDGEADAGHLIELMSKAIVSGINELTPQRWRVVSRHVPGIQLQHPDKNGSTHRNAPVSQERFWASQSLWASRESINNWDSHAKGRAQMII
jgi:hypothetical protein